MITCRAQLICGWFKHAVRPVETPTPRSRTALQRQGPPTVTTGGYRGSSCEHRDYSVDGFVSCRAACPSFSGSQRADIQWMHSVIAYKNAKERTRIQECSYYVMHLVQRTYATTTACCTDTSKPVRCAHFSEPYALQH